MSIYSERRPRSTAIWRKKLNETHAILAEAAQHPEIASCWQSYLDAVDASMSISESHPEYTEALQRCCWDLLYALIDAIRQHAPALVHIFGPSLINFVLDKSEMLLTGEILVRRWDGRLSGVPNSPIVFDREGRPDNIHQASRKQGLELLSICQTYNDARPRGRPRKPTSPPSKLSKRLNPEVARFAYHLKSDGAPWKKIVKLLYPDIPAAERNSEAMRKHIERLIDRGQTLVMEPTPKNQDDQK